MFLRTVIRVILMFFIVVVGLYNVIKCRFLLLTAKSSYHTNKPRADLHLPIEILTEIFINASHGTSDKDYNIVINAPTNSGISYPWNLMLVCKRWHEIIISFPRLWAHFYLNASTLPSWVLDTARRSKYDTSTPLYTSLVLCLSRSGNHPLRFRITGLIFFLEYPSLFLSQLLMCANRWEVVDLDFAVHDVDPGPLPHFSNTITCPQLQKLKIKTQNDSDLHLSPRHFPLLSHIFYNAPILSKIQYSGWPGYLSYNFDLFNITDFTTTIDPNYQDAAFTKLFSLMPALTCLSIIIKRGGSNLRTPFPGLSKSPSTRLRTLNLCMISPPGWTQTLRPMLSSFPPSPALTHLKISDNSSAGSFLDPLKDFLRRSRCTIKTLDLDQITSGPVLRLIQMLPQLESLNLNLVYFNTALCEGLELSLEHRAAECYGRQIKKMVIRYPVLRRQLQVDMFVKMLESRLNLSDDGGELGSGLMYLDVRLRGAAKTVPGLVESLTRLRSLYKGKMYISNN